LESKQLTRNIFYSWMNELQLADEQKATFIMESMDHLLDNNWSKEIVKQVQDVDLLLEFVLHPLMFIIQNKKSPSLLRVTLNVVTHILSNAIMKSSIVGYLRCLLEVCFEFIYTFLLILYSNPFDNRWYSMLYKKTTSSLRWPP